MMQREHQKVDTAPVSNGAPPANTLAPAPTTTTNRSHSSSPVVSDMLRSAVRPLQGKVELENGISGLRRIMGAKGAKDVAPGRCTKLSYLATTDSR